MTKETTVKIVTFGEPGETGRRRRFVDLMRNCPVPEEEFLLNLGLFLTPQTLSRVLFMDFLYRKVLTVQGVVMEFGCRWGQNVSLFSSLRGIYEPFNRLRKVVAFDTFAGFPRVTAKDGTGLAAGEYGVTDEYEKFLGAVLEFQEAESPLKHLKKHEVVKGDASVCVREYLERHPETIVALAYFDMDLYEPTRDCLLAIKDRLPRGAVLGFDELNDPLCPGETTALREVFGLSNIAVRRYRYNARTSYMVVGGR